MLFLLSRPKGSTDELSVSAENLKTLRSFAIRDRLEIARELRKGFDVQTTSEPARVESIDLAPLFERGVLDRADVEAARASGHLDANTSQLLLRYVRIFTVAVETFGQKNGPAWLLASNSALGGEVPVDLLLSEEGGRVIETLLGRIGYGLAS